MTTHDRNTDGGGAADDDAHSADGLIDASDVPGVTRETSSTERVTTGTREVPAESVGDQRDLDATAERRALLGLLIYAWDRARSPGVWERLTAGLAAVGVSVERPDGDPFDPNRHEVGGVQTTDDEALVDTIAETEVVGFTDRGTVVREPIVVVYRRA